mmetsp:Transcript_30264/g.96717  ORF Transcript_30264/g.96717 Transcript_30264/m.96717 type:complete len:205 (+) Transcript_30264:160-774(+)
MDKAPGSQGPQHAREAPEDERARQDLLRAGLRCLATEHAAELAQSRAHAPGSQDALHQLLHLTHEHDPAERGEGAAASTAAAGATVLEPEADGDGVLGQGLHVVPPACRDHERIARAEYGLHSPCAAQPWEALEVRALEIHACAAVHGVSHGVWVETRAIARIQEHKTLPSRNLRIRVVYQVVVARRQCVAAADEDLGLPEAAP